MWNARIILAAGFPAPSASSRRHIESVHGDVAAEGQSLDGGSDRASLRDRHRVTHSY